MTDKGSQLTDRFSAKNKKPSGDHAFDQTCTVMAIEHGLTTPRDPQINGMVECFMAASTIYCNNPDLTAGLIW